MNKRSFNKLPFLTLVTLVSTIFFSGAPHAADQYVVTNGGRISIDEHGTCSVIVNNTGNSIMVPTKTAEEWISGGQSFTENPAIGVTEETCCTGGQVYIDHAGGGCENCGFGWSVSLDGETLAIGEPGAYSNPNELHIYTLSGGVWSVQQIISAPAPSYNGFGKSLSLRGDTLLVGNYFYPGTNAGRAYVYTRSGTTWTLEDTLIPSSSNSNDYFAAALSLDDNRAVIGAYGNDQMYSAAGAVYIFTRSGSTWTQSEVIFGTSAAELFGYSVSISGNTIAAFSYGTNKVRIYTESGGTWNLESTISLPGSSGVSKNISLRGDTLLVGDPTYSSNTGRAYVYTRSGTTWTLSKTLQAGTPTAGHYFGWIVSLADGVAAIGSTDYQYGGAYVGYTTVYKGSGTTWTLSSTIGESTNPYGSTADFSKSLSTDGVRVLIGSRGDVRGGGGTGGAYINCVP